VGFAAETQNVERNALAKLEGKGLDMIAANQVGENLAFDCDDNALSVYWPGGRRELGSAPKRRLAAELVAVIAERYAARGQPAPASNVAREQSAATSDTTRGQSTPDSDAARGSGSAAAG
jgi:hypothetical protein